MKRIFVLVLTTLSISFFHHALAQDITLAQELHRKFDKMKIAESQTPEKEIYETLYKCYQEYVLILNDTSKIVTPDFDQAKQGLWKIHQYLGSGVVYYQRQKIAERMNAFAEAYIDVTLMAEMKNFTFIRDEQFAAISYLAACGAYNTNKLDKAIKYFAVYLGTGDLRMREVVYVFMARSCFLVNNTDVAVSVLEEAIRQYPKNIDMLKMAIQYYEKEENHDKLEHYVTMAVAVEPDNKTLLNIQGKVYEETHQFDKALEVYKHINRKDSTNLIVAQHIALNYYNLGVLNFNKANLQNTETDALKYSGQANTYFVAAESTMETILKNIPNSVKYMQALAVVYDCLGKEGEFKAMNDKLAGMGAATIEANVIPTLITHDSENVVAVTNQGAMAETSKAAAQSNVLQMLAQQKEQDPIQTQKYSVYAKNYVEPRLKEWQEKSDYETVAEYQARVSHETREEKKKELLKVAEVNYINHHTRNVKIRIDDMSLKGYDADHETFLIRSQYGELIVPVPRDKDEARLFENNWKGIQVKDPEFYINNDTLLLSALTFITPTGISYRYDGKAGMKYTETVVDISFDPLNTNLLASSSKANSSSRAKKQTLTIEGVKSDVDLDIPEGSTKNENMYALIIANENYGKVSPVPYALNDGETFAKYCELTLGIPKKNVLLHRDVSFGDMLSAVERIKDLAMACDGTMELIFYYAGHGIPNESSNDAYLLPVDADGKNTRACYSLNDIYTELGSLNARSVTVFLDACFSGAKRDGGMVVSARAVAIQPRPLQPKGNMVVFSAVSSDETALPYEDKVHGMFTYFLLKKLQATEGNVTLKELSDYIKKEVVRNSTLINSKRQTPTVKVSSALADTWQTMTLKKE